MRCGRFYIDDELDSDGELEIHVDESWIDRDEAEFLVKNLTKVFELDQDKSSPDTEEPEKVLYHFCIRKVDGGHQSGNFSIEDPHMDTFYVDAKEYIGELCGLSDGEYVILSLNRL